MNSNNRHLFAQRTLQGAGIFLLALLAATLIRTCLVVTYHPVNAVIPVSHWVSAFWMGMRFDAKWLATFLFLPWLCLVIATFLPSKTASQLIHYPVRFLLFLGVALFFVLDIINYFYYGFYQSPINSLIFGLFEDDTGAILKTIWQDYPVFLCLLIFFALLFAVLWLPERLSQRYPAYRAFSVKATAAAMIVVTCTLALLIRGSFGVFPLRENDLAVTNNAFVNATVSNGQQALYMAWKERRQNDLKNDPLAGLKKYGFRSPEEAVAFLKGQDDKNLRASLPAYPVPSHRPHVVFALMEAFGRELIDTHDPVHNDVLGSLASHLQTGDFFTRAISVEHGTFPSLEGILFDTPITPLMQSRYGYQPFPFSAVSAFKKAGYRTVFLTSGSGSWRSLDTNLLLQGFDQVLDQRAIQQLYPQAVAATWGVPDEFMFLYANELLEAADQKGEKVFLFMLSTTNHPPYQIPQDYQPGPLDPDRLPSHRTTDTALANSILETYQYANDCLGRFLNRLKSSSLADRTVVTVTGDHNTRSIFRYSDTGNLHMNYGVPIFFQLPPAWKPSQPKLNQWASHRDIFPTLKALVLGIPPDGLAGRNLYEAGNHPEQAVGFMTTKMGAGLAINDDGAVVGLSDPHYFVWNNGQLVATTRPDEKLRNLAKRAQASVALADWRIRSSLLKKP